jgi:hypothetical protein
MASITNVSTLCNSWQWSIGLPVQIEMKVTAIDNDYDVQSVLDRIRQTCEDMAAITARSGRNNGSSSAGLAAHAGVLATRPMPGAFVNGGCRTASSAMLGGESDFEMVPSAEDAADWLRDGIF